MNNLKKTKLRAWQIFSIWVRLRDCEQYQKGGMFAPCCTCGKLTHFKNLQAGHFLSGRGNAILFDEDCVHAQCQQCNIFKHGNSDNYWPYMVKNYGWDKTYALWHKKQQTRDYSISDLEDIIIKYQEKIEKLGGLDLVPKMPVQQKLSYKKKKKIDLTKNLKFPKVK